jgi:hypothetical protein
MEVSLAYFVYDLLCCLFIELDPVSLVHHVCTIAGLAVGVFQGKARRSRPSRDCGVRPTALKHSSLTGPASACCFPTAVRH